MKPAVATAKPMAGIAISGGIDSSVVLALCVRALGPDNVHKKPRSRERNDNHETPLKR